MNAIKTLPFFLLFVITYTAALPLQAQVQVYSGLRAGFVLATYNADHIDYRLENLQAYNVAIPVEISLGDHLSVYTELSYLKRGSHAITFRSYTDQHGTPLRETQSQQTVIDYLDIPLFIRLSSDTRGVNAYGFIGPELGVALRGKTVISKVGGKTLSDPPEAALSVGGDGPIVERYVIGTAFGLGMTAPVNRYGKFFVEARFHLGTTDVFANTPQDKITNQGTTLSLGYMMMLGG